MHESGQRVEFFTSADVARKAVEHGCPLTPAGVRVAVTAGRLVPAATTPGGMRLFSPGDVEAFLRQRIECRDRLRADREQRHAD